MTIDAAAFRRTMSRFATGVTVVATRHSGGGLCGLTVNAFASVSLHPSEVLVCVSRNSTSYPCLLESGVFAVSFLSSRQHDVAVRFAQRRPDKFEGIAHRPGVTGAPILDGAIAHLECELDREYPGGDHAIMLGRVVAIEAGEGDPLVFFSGGYSTVGPIELPAPGEPLPDMPEES